MRTLRFILKLYIRVLIVVGVVSMLKRPASRREKRRPAGGQVKPFVFPKQENYTLSNGMKVTLVEYGSVPKVAVQALVRAGSLNEKSGQRWISDMAATLLKEGTASRSASRLAAEAAEMGGSIFTAAGTDKTTIGGEVLSEFDTRFLNLMADVIQNPKFAAEDIEKVRANKLRGSRSVELQPGSIAWERFREMIFPGHAYGSVFPTEAALKSYSPQDIKSFYYNQFGAARTHLYIVGRFDAARLKAAIEKAFGNWKKGPDTMRNVPPINAKRSIDVIDRPGAPQSTIYLGMPAMSPSDADFVKFTVMDSLLGSSFGSRITSNIRENKGYTYSPTSFVWNRFKTGYWIENADVTTESTGASVKEILFEIERLKKEPPTEAELQGIKNYLVGIYVLNNSTRTGVLGQLENVNYNELGSDYLTAYVGKLAAVTPTDVSEMAKKYLLTDKMTLVVVGDKSKVTEQLKPYMR